MHRRDVLAFGLASLSASALAPLTAFAQARYPERPIKLMIAFSAGGVNDIVGRHWAERMKTLLGTVYVENQGGASGTIATAEARAQPDGHTLLLGSTSTMVLNPMTQVPRVPYDPVKDFRAHRHPCRLDHLDHGTRIRAGENVAGSSSPTPRPIPASSPMARPAPAP